MHIEQVTVNRSSRSRPLLWLCILLSFAFAAIEAARASPPATANGASSDTAPIRFTTGGFVFSTADTAPATGWTPHVFPSRKLLSIAHQRHIDPPTVWVRFQFDRTRFGTNPIAISASAIEQNHTLFVNGVELYRSYGDAASSSFSWNHPLLAPIPAAALRPGINDLTIRVMTNDPQPLIIGTVQVGLDEDIRAVYNRSQFFSIDAPEIISGYLLILTFGALTFWFKRPKEHIFGWLALVGFVWQFRNLRYFIQFPPFNVQLYWPLTTDSIFILLGCVFAFSVRYFAMPKPKQLTLAVVALCGAAITVRHGLAALHLSELPAFLLALPLSAYILVRLFMACRQDRQSGRWLMFAAIAASVAFSFHDLGWSVDFWKGAGVALQPYGGLLVFSAFDIALTTRLQNALVDVEDVNERLETRVADVTHSLQQSEASRAQMQVALAVDDERERIMREIHDGIGSSLTTALAVAKRSNASKSTIDVLRRSITDLKIAVDSLEPVEGDLVALLASLRHRMAPDLELAGIATVWNVEPCPPLEWLNPVTALHILRIIQESVSNILTHANAKTITLSCKAHKLDSRDGVLVTILDDGVGLRDNVVNAPGQGLVNMGARAESLSGQYSFIKGKECGAQSILWLPLLAP